MVCMLFLNRAKQIKFTVFDFCYGEEKLSYITELQELSGRLIYVTRKVSACYISDFMDHLHSNKSHKSNATNSHIKVNMALAGFFCPEEM